MIDELRARNIALIQDATMHFGKGLTVLTGETGAGKTALLNALKLVIGSRADASNVREGQTQAIVEASFTVDDESAETMRQMGFEVDGNQILVKRKLTNDGRSKCYVNNGMATVSGLSSTVGALVQLHGQHSQQALLQPHNHVKFLDAWAAQQLQAVKQEYLQAYDDYCDIKVQLDQALEANKISAYQIEQARFVCSQIEAVNPQLNEHDELEEQLPILRNGESLSQGAGEALQALRGEGLAIDLLAHAEQSLSHIRGTDKRLDDIADRISECMVSLEDVALELRAYKDDVEFDPAALQQTLDRLGELDGLVRKFGPTYEDMLQQWQASKQILEQSTGAADKIEQLQKRANECELVLREKAAALEAARTQAGNEFCAQLAASVEELAMQGATFQISEEPLPIDKWNSECSKRYELMYAPAANITPRALTKIASGGELSRVMLAIECMASFDSSNQTLVFDEVDAGIGGAAANAIATRLQQLAQTHQVIVVTHLAQVASVAQSHMLVSKTRQDGNTFTTIETIEGDTRVREIARMLSGNQDEAALQHARTLLKA